MSDLINAMNRIMAWLEEYAPASASGFQPGLSLKEIENKMSKLSFKVSEEVYELYAWRNGDESYSSIFGYLSMLNLERACEFSEFVNDVPEDVRGDDPEHLLPLFDFDGEYFAVQGHDSRTKTATIFHVSSECDVRPAFVSLTGMMMALAECYETGIYVMTEYGLEVMDKNKVKFGEIRLKHNPGMSESLYAEGW